METKNLNKNTSRNTNHESHPPSPRLGVDTGGTFTDFVWLDATGQLKIHKQLSTPADPSEAIVAGVAFLQVPEDTAVVHGSTVATNALLEKRGARTALITTAGFTDVLAIGRQNRPNIYALVPRKPAPLVPKPWRFGVNERATSDGEILVALDETELTAVISHLQTNQIQSVAVALLFSFLNPQHEARIKALLNEQLPDLHVSISSEILPEYREYERTATTVINAYVAPLMSTYLNRLARELAPRPLTVMQSNGGVITAKTAADEAARTALSGPAGGVVGAQFVAQKCGVKNLITFDMGGTSSDVALCPNRLPTTAYGEIADLPLRLPIIDIHTVGAGGGSLAFVDAGGALQVGPQSAGANPGPMCYGRSHPEWESWVTVTDANLILGRLDSDNFLGGEMRLNKEAAAVGMAVLAEKMGVSSIEEAAWGVIQVANANMERAIRKISVERGHDPRHFALVPFGGAGPLHACEMAENLQIPDLLIPPTAGVLSALGMLVAQPTKDYSKTVIQEIVVGKNGRFIQNQPSPEWLEGQFQPLLERAKLEMAAEGISAEAITFRYGLDMRYKGQSHELNVPCTEFTADLSDAFHQSHQTRYGYAQSEAVVEVVTVRLTAVSPITPPHLISYPLSTADASAAVVGQKEVWFNQAPAMTTLYDRAKLRAGNTFSGPAVVFQYDTTIVIPPEWETAVDTYLNLRIMRKL